LVGVVGAVAARVPGRRPAVGSFRNAVVIVAGDRRPDMEVVVKAA
jgi:hypothetical protein